MRPVLTAVVLSGLLVAPALAQPAAPSKPKMICIDTQRIKNTRVPDPRTILFYMNDGKIWKNTLLDYCPGLTFHGFVYTPTPPSRLCSNLETIRVLESGSICRLGEFTPYTPPPKPAPKN